MTLPIIKDQFFRKSNGFKFLTRSQQVAVLIQALDYLRFTARQDAAIYYGETDLESLTQTQIQEYLCILREYDAAEISHIVKAFKERFTKDE